MQFSESDLECLVDEPYRSRGAGYARTGLVEILEQQEHRASACVHGTHDYRVSLTWKNDTLEGDCTCPAYAEGEPCKHIAALGYALLSGSEGGAGESPASKKGRRGTLELVGDYLDQQSPETLRSLLLQEAKRNATFRKRLDMLRKTDSASVDVAGLRKALRQAIGSGKYVDYYEAASWANGINTVVDALQKLPRPRYAEDIKSLAEYGMELLKEALGHVDDSNGESGYAIETLKALHLDACRHCQIHPEAFGEFLFHKEWADGFDFYYDATTRYTEILGAQGVAAYRRAADAAWEALPQATPKLGGRHTYVIDEAYIERSHLRRIVDRLHRHDPEALVRIMLKDVDDAHYDVELARRYEAAGKPEQAIRAAEEGWALFCKTMPDAALQRYLVEAYHRHSQHQKALDLLWKPYDRAPHIQSYKDLKASASRADAWPLWREKLMARARKEIPTNASRASQKGSLIVSIHLEEKEPEYAWKSALQWGCYESLWLELASAHGALNRQEAVKICQQAAEARIRLTNNTAYKEALEWIRKTQHLQQNTEAGKQAFVQWIQALRTTHKAKKNMMRLLSSKGL